MGLETATDRSVVLTGVDIEASRSKTRTQERAQVQMVFQNPFDTLNPSMSVGPQIIRALEIFKIGNSATPTANSGCLSCLDLVKLPRALPTACRASCQVGRNSVWASPARLQASADRGGG